MSLIVYLECREDNHNKFYLMTEDPTGTTFVARWGRIGTEGSFCIKIGGQTNAKEAIIMSAISDAVNYFQSLYQSGDIKLAVDIALIVMLIWFIMRGVSRLFETLVLGAITIYGVNMFLNYIGVTVDYQGLLSQIGFYLNQFLTFINNNLPR